jgi:hypothetical protein
MQEIDQTVFDAIAENFLQKFSLKINIDVLKVLDKEDVSPKELEAVQHKIDPVIVGRLLEIGNSFYYGRLSSGHIIDFSKIITMRLGVRFSKLLIIASSFFTMKTNNEEIDHELELLFAKTISVWAIARNLASEMGLKKETVNLLEMVSLFHELGRIAILIYTAEHDGKGLTDEVTKANHSSVRGKIIERLQLPPFLNETLDRADTLSFDRCGIDLPTVIYLSSLAVEESFKGHGKLVIKSYLSDMKDPGSITPGTVISDFFSAVNLSRYIEVVQPD